MNIDLLFDVSYKFLVLFMNWKILTIDYDNLGKEAFILYLIIEEKNRLLSEIYEATNIGRWWSDKNFILTTTKLKG